MIEDISDTCRDGVSEADAVVVGSGIAGCEIALQIARSGRKVILFESGRRAFDERLKSKICGRPRSLPVVATDTEPVREIAKYGRDALLVPPNDPAALARGIEVVLNDADLAARLGTAARQTASRYSWDRRAAALESFLMDLLNNASKPD